MLIWITQARYNAGLHYCVCGGGSWKWLDSRYILKSEQIKLADELEMKTDILLQSLTIPTHLLDHIQMLLSPILIKKMEAIRQELSFIYQETCNAEGIRGSCVFRGQPYFN